MKTSQVAILYSGGVSFGGIENYLFNLLTKANRPGLKLRLISLGEWPLTKRLAEAGQPAIIWSAQRVNCRLVQQLGQYCQAEKIDLLVSQGVVANFYARLVGRSFKVKNLVTVHSDINYDYDNKFVLAFYKQLDRRLSQYTTHYLAVSHYLKQQLFAQGVRGSQTSVIYNGVTMPPAPRRQHKRLTIGSVGRLHPVKGYDLLIRAFALLDNQRLQLKIAGSGAEGAKLKALAQELGVAKRVQLVGFQEDLGTFLNSIDIYVQPSRCEGFGLALVQAMSQALPVVATPVGSLPEIIKDHYTGYLSADLTPEALAESLAYVVREIKESTAVGIQASQSVKEQFQEATWLQQTLDLYQKLANKVK